MSKKVLKYFFGCRVLVGKNKFGESGVCGVDAARGVTSIPHLVYPGRGGLRGVPLDLCVFEKRHCICRNAVINYENTADFGSVPYPSRQHFRLYK